MDLARKNVLRHRVRVTGALFQVRRFIVPVFSLFPCYNMSTATNSEFLVAGATTAPQRCGTQVTVDLFVSSETVA